MKKSISTRYDFTYSTTAGELAKFLASCPPGARVSVTKEKYYDQRDPGSTYISVSWTEEF